MSPFIIFLLNAQCCGLVCCQRRKHQALFDLWVTVCTLCVQRPVVLVKRWSSEIPMQLPALFSDVVYYVLTDLVDLITILTLDKPQRCLHVIAIVAGCSFSFWLPLQKLAGNRHVLSFFNLIMCILANDILKIWVEYIKISCSGDIAFLRNIFQFPFFIF